MKNCRSIDGSCLSSNPSSGRDVVKSTNCKDISFLSTLSRLLRNEMRNGSIVTVDELKMKEI